MNGGHSGAEQVDRHFIGREREQAEFMRLLANRAGNAPLLNVHGTGGIGKSRLLGQYRQLADQAGALFMLVDLRDEAAGPAEFLSLLAGELSGAACLCDKQALSTAVPADPVREGDLVTKLNALAAHGAVVLALDSYDKAFALDRWLRESFIPRLNGKIALVVSGRYPLDGEWRRSAYWAGRIVPQRLEPFTGREVGQFLAVYGMAGEDRQASAAAWSKGLPSALCMLPTMGPHEAWPDLAELAGEWLKETADESLRRLAEFASVARLFNKELLERIGAGEALSDERFEALTRLSFVSSTLRGWYIQDGIRDAIRLIFRKSKPLAYEDCRRNCIDYYMKLLRKSGKDSAGWLVRELVFHLADSLVRTVATVNPASANVLETLSQANFDEVSAYLERRKIGPAAKHNRFYDHDRDKLHTLHMTQKDDELRAGLVDPADWLALGLDSVKLLRQPDGTMLGLLAVIPIDRHTLDHLTAGPVTGAYFRTLSIAERLALAVPRELPAGWYIRMIDAEDPSDAAARSELIAAAIGYLASGGKVLLSTYNPFYIEFVRQLGFEEVPGAVHTDYDEEHPSHTYMLDLGGNGRERWLERLDARNGPMPMTEELPLTDRERDIARLLIQGQTNAEIAGQLFLSEITVKKHVSRMLEKTNTRNRAQLARNLRV